MTHIYRLTDFPRAAARGDHFYPTIFRRRGAVRISDRAAGLRDFRTRITGIRGNGFQPTSMVQCRVGLRQFLRSDAIDKLHHAELFGLVKFKSQHLHEHLFCQAQRSCQFRGFHTPEPEFRKYYFVSYGDLSFPCSGTFLWGKIFLSLSSKSL